MRKKRLNWKKVWEEFDKWFDGPSEAAWNWVGQKRKIASLVESARNEKLQERKRKTRK